MEQKDWKTYRDYLDGAYEQYNKPPLSDRGATIMFANLRDLTLDAVLEGINRHVRTNRFVPPNAAAIREAILGNADDAAVMAYDKVIDALKIIRSGDSVRFDDPCIHFALKQCRGWTGFCMMDIDEARKLFLSAYATAHRRRVSWCDVPDHMSGWREQRGDVLNPWTPEQIKNVDQLIADRAQKKKALTA